MKKTVIVAFNGPQKVGKDTTCEMFQSFLSEKGIRASMLKFAEPVKEIFSLAYRDIFPDGYEESQGFKHKLLPNGKRVRDALVHIGNGMRDFDEDLWVRLAVDSIVPNAVNIISDLRFENEAMWVKGKHKDIPVPDIFAGGWTGIVVELKRKEVGYSGIAGERPLPPELIDYRYTNVTLDQIEDQICVDLYQELWRLNLITREMIRPGK